MRRSGKPDLRAPSECRLQRTIQYIAANAWATADVPGTACEPWIAVFAGNDAPHMTRPLACPPR